MKKQEVIDIIALHKDELRQMGVASLELFGSVVRDEATETSDVDLMATFDHQLSLFDLAEVQLFLEEILGVSKVDLVIRKNVYEELKENIFGEAIRVA